MIGLVLLGLFVVLCYLNQSHEREMMLQRGTDDLMDAEYRHVYPSGN